MGIFNFIRKRRGPTRRRKQPATESGSHRRSGATHYAEHWSPEDAEAKLEQLLAAGHEVRAVTLPSGELVLLVDPLRLDKPTAERRPRKR